MYVFEDRGGRLLALRPEGTAGIARAFIQHSLGGDKAALKLFYIYSIYRYERPQAGRYRQSHQVGAECFGPPGPNVDAEMIALNLAWYRELGIRDHRLRLNSVGCPICRPAHRTALQEALRKIESQLCATCQGRLDVNPMRVFDCKNPSCQALLVDAPSTLDYLCEECTTHLAGLRVLLDGTGVEYEMDRKLVRGLDYYTRTAFEVKFTGLGAQDSLSGGGRYDSLVEQLGGKPTPAIGFAAGIERALLTLEQLGVNHADPLPRGAYFIGLGEEAHTTVVRLAERLRQLGGRAEFDHYERGLKPQLKQANRLGARFAVIIGENELATGKATVRDLDAKEQVEVPLEETPAWIAGR